MSGRFCSQVLSTRLSSGLPSGQFCASLADALFAQFATASISLTGLLRFQVGHDLTDLDDPVTNVLDILGEIYLHLANPVQCHICGIAHVPYQGTCQSGQVVEKMLGMRCGTMEERLGLLV